MISKRDKNFVFTEYWQETVISTEGRNLAFQSTSRFLPSVEMTILFGSGSSGLGLFTPARQLRY
jgi:hypothetical protein